MEEFGIGLSTVCRIMNVNRTSFYYKQKQVPDDTELRRKISDLFKQHRSDYGSHKLLPELTESGFDVSRYKVSKIMTELSLFSKYHKPRRRKCGKSKSNEVFQNILNRDFNNWKPFEAIVSDTTYISINSRWYYLCIMIDLCSRMIVGSSIGCDKNAELVEKAFVSMPIDLRSIKLFHSDPGTEYINETISYLLDILGIQRSVSRTGTPYDNAVAEATFKIIKTELINNVKFKSLVDFELQWFEYMNRYNNTRIHGSLGYITPATKLKMLDKK